MTQTVIKRHPAQLPPELHDWATRKAQELDVPIAAVWRGVTPMLVQAEQLGAQLVAKPAQPDQASA